MEDYERLFERALRALDRERPARRVLRRLRDDVGQAVELLNTMERFDGETDDAQAQYIQALERFRKEVQTLPGLAEERLRLVSDALAAAEPSLIEQGDPEPEFARRAFLGRNRAAAVDQGHAQRTRHSGQRARVPAGPPR